MFVSIGKRENLGVIKVLPIKDNVEKRTEILPMAPICAKPFVFPNSDNIQILICPEKTKYIEPGMDRFTTLRIVDFICWSSRLLDTA